VDQASHESVHGEEDVVTTCGVTNFLTLIGVLLIGENEHTEGGGLELVVRSVC
jgi:hypothetical protein